MDEAALRRLGRKRCRRFRLVVVGAGEIGRAGEEFHRHRGRDRLDRQLRRICGSRCSAASPAASSCAPCSALASEAGRSWRSRRSNSSRLRFDSVAKPRFPFLARGGAAAAGFAPGLQHVVGHRERLQRNAELFLGALEFVGAERLAMGLRGAGLGRRAIADRGLAGDHRRLVGLLRPRDRGRDRLLILAVDQFGRPAGRLEALHLVDRVGNRGRPVDRNAVVVIQHDQLVELPVPGQRDRFLRHAFHQVAVGGEHIGVMVDDLLAEFRRQHLLRQRHADRGRDALAERAGRGLDALGVEVFRMTRRQRSELAEMLDLVERHVLVAGEIQQRIEQHRAMAGRQHEAVAVRPVRRRPRRISGTA